MCLTLMIVFLSILAFDSKVINIPIECKKNPAKERFHFVFLLRFHHSYSQNSDISTIWTKYSCDLQMIPFNGAKQDFRELYLLLFV